MKKILSLVLVGLIVSLGSNTIAQQDYSSEKCNCSITFPAAYEESSKDGDGYTTHKLKTSLDEELYFFSYTVHSTDVADSLVDVSVESFNSTLGGTITETKTWKVKGAKGKKVYIDLPAQESKLIYCCVITNNIQYQVVYGNIKDKYDEKKAKKFFKSFKLKK